MAHSPWHDSDQQWLDALTQAQEPALDSAAAREAQLLRHALQRDIDQVSASADYQALTLPEAQAAGLRRLMADVEQRQLLRRPSRNRRWWFGASAGMATVVAALLLARLMPVRAPDYGLPPDYRGGIQVVHRAVAHPRQQAEATLQQLQAAGLAPAIYQKGKAYIVDAEADPEQAVAAAQVLRALQAQAQPGIIRWEYQPQP